MHEKIEGKSGASSIRQYIAFLVITGAAILFFALGFVASASQNKLGGIIASALMILAGSWMTYRTYLNIKMKDGILRIDEKEICWELKGRKKVVSLTDVEQLSSWTGFTVLKDARGRKLMAFPENQDNYNDILIRLTSHIRNKHNQSLLDHNA